MWPSYTSGSLGQYSIAQKYDLAIIQRDWVSIPCNIKYMGPYSIA